MASTREIVEYFDVTAQGAYERWGGPTKAIHFGYFDYPELGFNGCQPEDVPAVHFASLNRMSEKLLEFAHITPSQKVIDAGCGYGNLTKMISHIGAYSFGVNISHLQLQKAKNSVSDQSNIHFLSTDFGHLPFAPRSFDRVLFLETLVHANDKDQVLKDVVRVLTPGGVVAIADYLIVGAPDKHSLERINTINRGWVLDIVRYWTLVGSLYNNGLRKITLENITDNVLPSMQLAAASASEHLEKGEQAADVVTNHRVATANLYDLMRSGHLGYFLVKAEKPLKTL